MNVHKNASMTPKGRAHLVEQIALVGLTPAASAAGVSPRTARKWRDRHAAQGPAGLHDRSSRPQRSPKRSDASKLERAVALRRTQRLTYACIAERVGLSKSTVARSCQGAGIAWLPPLQPHTAPKRYERQRPGELLHLDTKKLARFEQPGHRVTGDRTRYTPRAGWQALHVAIDDLARGVQSDAHRRDGQERLRLLARCPALLPAPGRARRTGHDRQRLGLQVATLRQAAAAPGHPPHPHSPPTPHAPTARPNASSRRFCASGPMRTATPVRSTEPTNCSPGCTTTTSIDLTRPLLTDLPPLALASAGTTA